MGLIKSGNSFIPSVSLYPDQGFSGSETKTGSDVTSIFYKKRHAHTLIHIYGTIHPMACFWEIGENLITQRKPKWTQEEHTESPPTHTHCSEDRYHNKAFNINI